MAGDFKPPQRRKIALDNRKLTLTAINQDRKRASLQWGLISNNPRITVWTNVETDAEKKISANLDTPTFFIFLNLLNQAIEADITKLPEGEFKRSIKNKAFIFPGGKRSDEPVIQSTLWVGKDKEGCVWMSVTATNRPLIKFVFELSEFHQIEKENGTPLSRAEASVLQANAIWRVLSEMVPHLQVTEWVEPEQKPRNGAGGGGNGGGNWNRNGSGGGNQQRSSAPSNDFEVDADLPF